MDSDKRKRLLLIVAGTCIGLWLADSVLLTPLIDLYNTRSGQIEQLQQDVDKGSGLLDRTPALKAKWKSMTQGALPDRISDAETAVLESVGRWTSDSRLNVTSVKPRWNPAKKDAQTLEIQLEGVGDIDAVAKFIYDMESDALPLRVEDLEISSQDDKGSRLNLSLRFSGIVYKEEAGS